MAAGSWAVGLDNVSHLSSELSDAMCRAVTGDGYPRRRLYTDGDIVVTAFRRVLLLNGIELGSLSADLLDRAAMVELARIRQEDRRLESEILSEYERQRPALLAQVLDLAVHALRHLPEVSRAAWPRMADHAWILAAVDLGCGGGYLDAYLGIADSVLEEAVESDVVALSVRDFMGRRASWEGTASELLELLTPEQPPRSWPRTPQHLSGRLLRAAPILRSVGVEVERMRLGQPGSRTIRLTRPEVAATWSSAPSVASAAQAETDAADAADADYDLFSARASGLI
ncbi:MAG: hypothetical protein ACYC7C_05155 [Coriobacteriia bacterium]